jgi:hypothetical protein
MTKGHTQADENRVTLSLSLQLDYIAIIRPLQPDAESTARARIVLRTLGMVR